MKLLTSIKIMKKFTQFLFVTLTLVSVSCNKGNDPIVPAVDDPVVTAPTGITVQVGNSVDLAFIVEAPGKIALVEVVASSGVVSGDFSSLTGQTSGTVMVNYTAPATAGSQTITVTVTDQQASPKKAIVSANVMVSENMAISNEVVSVSITADATWTADRIWELASKVVIEDGVTLTIEPGTIVKGRTGTGSLATALIIARGGKLMAQGTANKPIIFTTIEDNIEVGQLMGTNLTEEDVEMWGGLVILGKAPISAENGDTEAQIEGIPADEPFGTYGGSLSDDNSGTITYVSVRHGGALIGEGNEINGITLGGVGSGTTMDHIEVYATLDDGIEFFGGTVNLTNVIISYQQDDGLDIDQNYSGTVTNFLVQHGGISTDEGLEIDGPEGTTNVDGLFTLKNGIVRSLGGTDVGTPADLKSKAQGTIDNVTFMDYPSGDELIKIRASYNDADCSAKEDAFTHFTDATPTLNLMTSNFAGVTVYTKSTVCTVSDADQTAANNAASPSGSAAGADTSEFENWTIASLLGIL